METQDLSCTYLAHRELESVIIIVISIIIITIVITQESENGGPPRNGGSGYAGGPHSGSPQDGLSDCILLAACGANELLPQSPHVPADVFTACLTTPIKARSDTGATSEALRSIHMMIVYHSVLIHKTVGQWGDA